MNSSVSSETTSQRFKQSWSLSGRILPRACIWQ